MNWRAKLFIATVSAAGGAVAVIAAIQWSPTSTQLIWASVALLAGLYLGRSLHTTPAGARFTMAPVALLLAYPIYGIEGLIVTSVLVELIDNLVTRRPLSSGLFNAGSVAVKYSVMLLLCRSVGWDTPAHLLHQLFVLGLGGQIMSALLVGNFFSLLRNQPFSAVFAAMFTREAILLLVPEVLFTAVLGQVVGYLGQSWLLPAMALVLCQHYVIHHYFVANRRLAEQADRDSMTQLLNHRALHKEFEQVLLEMKRQARPLSLLMIDLSLKVINDTYGHQVGDESILSWARLLRLTAGEEALIGRTGGDEFVVVLPRCPRADAQRLVERIRTDLPQQITVDGRDVPVAVGAVGIACFPDDATTAWSLINLADSALYSSKGAAARAPGAATKLH